MKFRSIISSLVATAVSITALPAMAATFAFNVQVVESIDVVPSPTFDLPDVGTVGTVTFLLDAATLDSDGDPLTGINVDSPLPQSLADAEATIGGLTSGLSEVSIFGFPGGARFSNGSFSNIIISLAGADCIALSCTLAGSFSILKPGAPAPTLFADVEALLLDPDAVARFSFNGTVQGEFVSFVAESVPTPVIPLPAGGILLLSGLMGFAAFRGRQRKVTDPR